VQKEIDFNEIMQKIKLLQKSFNPKISFEKTVENAALDLIKLQELFNNWIGVSAEEFFTYIHTLNPIKTTQNQQKTLFAVAEKEKSLQRKSFEDFIAIKPLLTEENIKINYSFVSSIFGDILIASTEKGICFLDFYAEKEKVFTALKESFPHAVFQEKSDVSQQNALLFFQENPEKLNKITLHFKGTDFQLKVWKSLLEIPTGKLSTYGNIAKKINKPKASRAVGTAIGKNPIAFLIPCHRVVQQSGKIGGYKWNPVRKTALIGWENFQVK